MNKCPICDRVYEDAVHTCLEDGTTLVRADAPAVTAPAQPAFQAPSPPTLNIPAAPTMSVLSTLVNIFVAPARAFASFREITTFTPAAVRFLVAAPIILAALMSYQVIYLARIGQDNITRAAFEASPQLSRLPPEQKEHALQMQQTPTFRVINLVTTFARLLGVTVVSMFLGALIYWVGALIFKSPFKYMQALLVWTYAALPVTVLWTIVNVITVFVWPPTDNVAIALGAAGVFRPNLGALFTVETLPLPVYVVALSNLDLFEFYGLTLASLGLRKAARLPWIGALGIVALVWLFGVAWRVLTAGLLAAILR